MRQGVGEVATLNIIIIFILIVFGLLAATINYYKAYKVNARILDVIEKYEGYNNLAVREIDRDLNTLGYTKANPNWQCNATRGNGTLENNANKSHDYCVYYFSDDRGSSDRGSSDRGNSNGGKRNKQGEPIYYNYSVVTYIYIDLPIIGDFRIPVHTKGERTYNFSDRNPLTS